MPVKRIDNDTASIMCCSFFVDVGLIILYPMFFIILYFQDLHMNYSAHSSGE